MEKNSTVYVLFQTDKYRTISSRICFGVYSSKERAKTAAKKNGLFVSNADVVIIVCNIDDFEEL